MKHKTNNKKANAHYFRRMFQVSSFKFHEKGFTLIELLVAVGVIAIISSLVFANVNTSKKNLSRSAQKLALDIRQAQNLSLAPSDSPICVYGVRAESSTSYFLYKRSDCPDPRTDPLNNGYDGNPANIIDTVLLNDISIASAVPFDMSFEAPEPITYLNGATGTVPMLITLQSPTATKNVSVNRFGRVETQ